MSIALDALIEISHLMGAPVGCYPDCAKVLIYEQRVQRASEIARRVLVVLAQTAATPLPPSSLDDHESFDLSFTSAQVATLGSLLDEV